ncbi:MAG: aminotransferase V, partial [Chloroflexi bacterium]
ELANRLGYGHLWPQSEEELIRYAFKDTGVSLEEVYAHPEGIQVPEPELRFHKYETGELRADHQPGFDTPTGKFEVSSEWLRTRGYEPLPVYIEPVEGPIAEPDVSQHFPLILSTGARTQTAFRSQHMNIESLVSRQPRPLVHIHPRDAQQRGICSGDRVDVVTRRGKVAFWARVTEDILPGVVEVNMGGGGPLGPEAWQNANVNELTDFTNREPLSGFPVYKALLCEVSKHTD